MKHAHANYLHESARDRAEKSAAVIGDGLAVRMVRVRVRFTRKFGTPHLGSLPHLTDQKGPIR